MNAYSTAWVRLAGVSAAICVFMGAGPVSAAVKLIGGFEGDMASPYINGTPILWTTTAGGGAVPDMTFGFINISDVDYIGGVTSGEQTLVINHPIDWNGGPYLRLHGNIEFVQDMANFPYLMFDVTTYGGPANPEEGPVSRQIFTIFNNPVTGFYDANFDDDIQQDPDVAGFDAPFLTSTVVIDMTGPDPAIGGDEKVFMNLKAQEALAGPPPDYWQLFLVFIGEDTPAANPIQTIIDNVRFCSDLACTPESLLGDFNDDGNVDAADYVLWRKFENTMTTLPNDNQIGGIVGSAHYELWRTNFGNGEAGGGGVMVVPEPAGLFLVLTAFIGLLLRKVRS
jgi:hypothetical protein